MISLIIKNMHQTDRRYAVSGSEVSRNLNFLQPVVSAFVIKTKQNWNYYSTILLGLCYIKKKNTDSLKMF